MKTRMTPFVSPTIRSTVWPAAYGHKTLIARSVWPGGCNQAGFPPSQYSGGYVDDVAVLARRSFLVATVLAVRDPVGAVGICRRIHQSAYAHIQNPRRNSAALFGGSIFYSNQGRRRDTRAFADHRGFGRSGARATVGSHRNRRRHLSDTGTDPDAMGENKDGFGGIGAFHTGQLDFRPAWQHQLNQESAFVRASVCSLRGIGRGVGFLSGQPPLLSEFHKEAPGRSSDYCGNQADLHMNIKRR